jgi:hypothetical protein
MANGTAALRIVDNYEPDPTEIAIGEAMAAAAAAVGQGLFAGSQTGKLDRTTVANGGRAMSPIVEFALAYRGADWTIVARRAGREEIYRRIGAPAPGVDVEELLQHVIAIAGRVMAAVAH